MTLIAYFFLFTTILALWIVWGIITVVGAVFNTHTSFVDKVAMAPITFVQWFCNKVVWRK